MLDWLRKMLQLKYVCALEADVARLRTENRALMNSLLGTAGFPPVEFPEAAKPQPLPRVRKRSWHQIQAWRANGAAQEAREADAGLDSRNDARTNGPVPHS